MLTLHGPLTITTDASAGTFTGYSGRIHGKLVAIIYKPGSGGTIIAAGADLTFTAEDTGLPILTVTNAGASNLFLYPRAGMVNGSNAAITDSRDFVRLFNERVKLAIAQGGNSKTGSWYVLAESDGGRQMQPVKHTAITLTCDGAGDVTQYSKKINGRIVGIIYTQGTIDNGATITLTGETTGTPIVAFAGNASSPIYPRAGLVGVTNVAITDSYEQVRIFDERVKLVVAAGGAAGAGSVQLLTEE